VRILTIAVGKSESLGALSLPAVERAVAAGLASRNAKNHVQLLIELGVLRVMQGRDGDAIALYEEALKKVPGNVVLLNNLAVLLSEIPGRATEALHLVEMAVAAVPGSREVHDSKALVLMGLGRIPEAREALDRLCRGKAKNPRYRLHLAMVLQRLNELDGARDHVRQALKDGLEDELLTPSERRQLKEIAGTAPRQAASN
jgi:Flp pilus assembly protein TadD